MTLHHRNIFYGLLVSVLIGLASCTADDIFSGFDDADPLVLQGISASIVDGPESRSLTDDERQFRALVEETRMSRAVAPLVDQIGKYDFLRTDEIVFTTIERTKRPIRPDFSYNNVIYSCEIAGKNDVSWKRLDPLQDIYWSDGASPHTFKGYILPHPDGEKRSDENFDWNYNTGRDYYYGSIGNPTETPNVSDARPNGYIDYQGSTEPDADASTPYSTELLRKEDLLLTYDTDMQNEDAMAWVHFHHGLASVRVTVTITGYSTTGEDPDSEARVSNMFLLNQPTMYKWNNEGYTTEPLVEEDQGVLNTFSWGGGTAPAWNQKRDMRLWQPRIHHGSGVGRTFTFYGITAPGERDEVQMTFHVSYPDPLDPQHKARLEREYTSTLKLDRPIEFRPGYCTSININLNHKNEKMTVGAEYMSWQYVDQPDEGTLRKNSTFLSYTDRSKVTIVGDAKATIDDATWLYQTTDAEGNPVIYDIYGNDGSETHPYLICTADQLLSFAYEVKTGRDFMHKFVKLDSDITMQPSKDVAADKRVRWIGIGDDTHPFNGFFLGSGRYINNLYGENFFHTVGDNAVIDKLNFSSVVEVQGCGVVAHKNLGLICGCHIEGDVRETSSSALYTGSIVGENHSFIIACAHVGKVSGYGTVGGLVGFNNGTVMACYHAGEIVGLGGTTDIHATVGKRGDGLDGTNNSIMFSCYYDESMITHEPTLTPSKSGFPFSTNMMQSNLFVNGDKEFLFDTFTGAYIGQSQMLQEVLLYLMYGDEGKDANASKTAEQLMNELVADGLTGRVNEVFGYHFSLNEALKAFRLWLNAMPEGENVHTNCHDFTPQQIQFLKQHYNAEHKFIYAPATYPKVQ